MRLRKRERKYGPSWFIVYVDHNGHRKEHVLKGIKTQKNAELAFADFQLKFERGQLGLATDENMTLDEALEAVIKDRRRNNCSKAWLSTLEIMRTTVTRFFGKDRRFKSLDDVAMADYRNHRSDEDGMLPETVNKELSMITAAGRLALAQGKIPRLPWDKIIFAADRTGRQSWSYLKTDEVGRLLNFLRYGGKVVSKRKSRPMTFTYDPRPKLWAMVTFLLNVGCRKGEMFQVRWGDVDVQTKTIRIVGSKLAKNGKSASIRYIPMNATLDELFSILPRGGNNDLVFKNDNTLNRDFRLALRYAGIRHVRVHDLRHTFASHLVMAGVPLYTVGKLLGHASIEMTAVYSHLCPDTLASAVQSLHFSPAPTPERGGEK